MSLLLLKTRFEFTHKLTAMINSSLDMAITPQKALKYGPIVNEFELKVVISSLSLLLLNVVDFDGPNKSSKSFFSNVSMLSCLALITLTLPRLKSTHDHKHIYLIS